jgi:hypothetical protein
MVCGGFLTVEHMRRGCPEGRGAGHPPACRGADPRGVCSTTDGSPKYQLNFYAVNKRASTGGCRALPVERYAAHDGSKGELRDTAYLYSRR